MIVETQAIVLRTMNYGDSSKIVTLYSKKFGKIKVVAKGVRSQKMNKFGSSLEPMTYSSVVLYKKEHKDLHLLSKSEIVRPFMKIQDDSEKLFTGLALIELVNMVMHDEEENGAVFTLLAEALETVNGIAKNVVNVFYSFQLKLFSNFGFGITLDQCIRCRRDYTNKETAFVMLRLSDGKFVCSACSAETSAGGVRITGGVFRTLQFFQMNDIAKAGSIQLTNGMKDEINATLQSYLRYHIEGSRTIQSISMLQS